MKRKTRKSTKARRAVAAIPAPNRAQESAITLRWTFLTNHTHVLLCLFRRPDQRLRDVAKSVGITERMVQRIVAELVESGYLVIEKIGRCNRYSIDSNLQLRHPQEMHHSIGELLKVLSPIPRP
jgi:hypothetical protein